MFVRKALLFSVLLICSVYKAYSEQHLLRSVEIDPDLFLSDNTFTYYEDKVKVSMDLLFPRQSKDFSFVFLSGESALRNNLFLMLDGNTSSDEMSLFVSSDMEIKKESVRVPDFMNVKKIRVFIEMDIRRNILRCSLTPSDTLAFNHTDFSVNDSYRFSVHKDIRNTGDPLVAGDGIFIRNLSISANEHEQTGNSVYWYYVIVVADILIFLIVYLNHRKRKRKGSMPEEESIVIPEVLVKPGLPTRSAIYLFGGLRVFNKAGEDITKRYSPILKELLTLLIIHSDKKGISADKLKTYLWNDKSVASARNNRAVNLGKLRNLLAEVGNFEIKSDDGYWRIDSDDVFIDYLSYKSVLKTPGILSKHDIELLCKIAVDGNILPEQQYEWLDALKGEICDDIFDKFIAFSNKFDEVNNMDLYIGIADVMFKFESINEQALALKCKTYANTGRHSAAKISYDKFSDDYRAVYGEEFPSSFSEILNK